MADDEGTTLEDQFAEFARFPDAKVRDGETIDLYRSDYWLRQGKILEDRKLNMTETGLLWMKFEKTELNYSDWCDYLTELCAIKEFDQEFVDSCLTNCGLPGTGNVYVPQYRDFFDHFKPRSKLIV